MRKSYINTEWVRRTDKIHTSGLFSYTRLIQVPRFRATRSADQRRSWLHTCSRGQRLSGHHRKANNIVLFCLLVAKIMQSAYSMCYFSSRSIMALVFIKSTKKIAFLAFLTSFLILGKNQNGIHYWWRHRPPAVPPPLKYTTKGKIVSKYCNISKTPGFHPPPPLVPQ